MREPNELELQQIKALTMTQDYEHDTDRIVVMDGYVSDGPSWCGKIALAIGGESCFVSTFEWNNDGTISWNQPPDGGEMVTFIRRNPANPLEVRDGKW